MSRPITPLNAELVLDDKDLIISKTCLKGRITYANRRFMEVAGFPEQALLRQPHNLIRHPDMPKAVYRLMWQTLKEHQEFFGFVKNLCADGSYYWVFANVTPDLDEHGQTRGYYSVRRKPPAEAVEQVSALYREMLEIEKAGSGTAVIDRSVAHLQAWLDSKGVDYFRAMMNLYRNGNLAGA